jgi:hypothetical protein
LNDVLDRFRQVLEVVDSPLTEAFESAAYANFATPAAFNFNSLPKPARKPIGHVAYLSLSRQVFSSVLRCGASVRVEWFGAKCGYRIVVEISRYHALILLFDWLDHHL